LVVAAILVQIVYQTIVVSMFVLITKISPTILVTTKLLEIFQSDATATLVLIATQITVAQISVLITGILQTILVQIRLLEICQMDVIAI